MFLHWLQGLRIAFLATLASLHAAPVSISISVNAPRLSARTAAFAPNYARAVSADRLWRWPQLPLRVFIAGHNELEKQQARDAVAGFDEWVAATHGAVRYVLVNSPSEAQLTVRFTSEDNIEGRAGVVGETNVASAGGLLRGAQMRIATGGATPADLRVTAAHEFGHALGIGGHSDDPADLMYPRQVRYISFDHTPIVTPPHPITQRDINTLRVCYPDLMPSLAARVR